MDATTRTPTRNPRWIVAGLIVVGLLTAGTQFGFMIADAAREKGVPPVGRANTVAAAPIGNAFRPVSSDGLPSIPVLASLGVPANSSPSGTVNYDRGSGTFDRAAVFTSPLSPGAVLSFYETFLPHHGWRLRGIYPAPDSSGREAIADRAVAGSEWEVAVASPAPRAGPESKSAASRPVSNFEIRLQLVDDQG